MNTHTITLDAPIKRGETEITSIDIRKPNTGALRGISMRGLLDFDADAIVKVLPRVTEPPLTAADIERMDPADLLQAGSVLAGFLLPKQVLEQVQQSPL